MSDLVLPTGLDGLVDPTGRPLAWQKERALIGTPTPLGPVVQFNSLPTQHPSRDWCLYAAQYGGPETGLDVRMVLDRRAIGALLDACTASQTGRCIVGLAGIVVEHYESRTGSRHPWARLVLIGRPPRPEEPILVTSSPNSPEKLAAGAASWTSNPGPEEHSTLVRRVTLGGPESGRDHRVYFDDLAIGEGDDARRPLTRLLTLANMAPSGRVLLGQCGVRERAWRAKSGHVYKHWTFVHRPAVVERRAEVE